MKELREYQLQISKKGASILGSLHLVYLSMEVRTGKTATSLNVCKISGFKNVLFLTKKKAIESIEKDYTDFGFDGFFKLTVINNESMHKIVGKFDCVIHDESHRCFLGNTEIEGVKIKDINIGSFQKSFNFVTQEYEYKKVLNIFKNKLTENLVKINCNGKEIVCTENHEIFTRRGWVRAKEILPTDELQVV